MSLLRTGFGAASALMRGSACSLGSGSAQSVDLSRSFASASSPSSSTLKAEAVTRLIGKLSQNSAEIEPWLLTTPSRLMQTSTRSSDRANEMLTRSASAKFDPFAQVELDLLALNENIKRVVRTEHPLLSDLANHYFDVPGKRFRPVLVLLVSQAVGTHLTGSDKARANAQQLQLAEIVELIHAASIMHDDVIDEAATRRSQPTVNAKYSNKLAILAGDFMLAKASLSLARLQNHAVSELMSTTISELVEGEFMQMRSSNPSSFNLYMKKTYLKTGSLITSGCRSAAILGNAPDDIVENMSTFGKSLGMAFQFVDDLLDFTGTDESLGKPAGIDLQLGLATGPVLFAIPEYPQLQDLVDRRFSVPGDAQEARRLVLASRGLEKTKELAIQHCEQALEALSVLKPSSARDSLVCLAQKMLDRSC